ncbi:MAG: epoxyqueuosine reductase QueH [Lachnospiraceae bacterium]|nr:epoxyqueuosine reductase QueH [Lachnospiraceae bacterium]
MSQNRNYQKELERILGFLEKQEKKQRLLLHACCAPCSSWVLEYLADKFEITLYFYNPNIFPELEYQKRALELQRLVEDMFPKGHSISICVEEYDPDSFYNMAKGLEQLPEGGERCFRCYELRMRKAIIYASTNGFDYFTTTLSISPHKNAEKINEIGEKLSEEFGIKHLTSDFKKKDGYKRSIELSKEYQLYRQNYCGCIYSKLASEEFMNGSLEDFFKAR